MSKRIGLPVTLKMRHDAHYVETLTSYSGASIGRMIPIGKIRPNPDQPRKFIGDVTELSNSIREKGVLEPLPEDSEEDNFEFVVADHEAGCEFVS